MANDLIPNQAIRVELAWMVGATDEHPLYFRVNKPEDGADLNEAMAAYRGRVGILRFSDEERLRTIDDFAEGYLAPFAAYLTKGESNG